MLRTWKYIHISAQKVTLVEDQWHQICFVWENSNGSWKLYQDGKETAHGHGVAKNHEVVPGGSLVLGQDQDKVGGGFDSSQAFVGDLSGVNMWNEVLSGEEISSMSKQCHSGEGNVFEWSDFKSYVHGNAKVVEPSSCGLVPEPRG